MTRFPRCGRLRLPWRPWLLAAALLGTFGCLGAFTSAGLSTAAPEPASAEDNDLRREGDKVIVPDRSPYRSRIAVEPVDKRVVERTIALPAQVEADPARMYNVLPPLSGRVVELKTDLGERVTKGQPLVVIDSSDLAQALSDLAKATSQVALTHRALERARGLAKAGGGSIKDLESATNDAAQADSELTRAQSRLSTLTNGAAADGPRTLTVSAPASGTVTALSTAAGAYINDATQSMMTITNLDRVWVTANVPEADIGQISVNQPVDLTFVAYPEMVLHGTVLFISAITEADTRRTKVRVAVPDANGRLRPNMYATARFHAPPAVSITVPDSALLMNNDSTSVFVETAPWTFERRDVGTGSDDGSMTVVTRGLAAGERVVVRGGVLLNE